jgi:4-hydroxy-3-methylbut-2-enyl diphosphate reductase IspH
MNRRLFLLYTGMCATGIGVLVLTSRNSQNENSINAIPLDNDITPLNTHDLTDSELDHLQKISKSVFDANCNLRIPLIKKVFKFEGGEWKSVIISEGFLRPVIAPNGILVWAVKPF